MRTMSSRTFNQQAGEAKKAALDGPVFITDRGRPSHVLMSIDEYRRITGSAASIIDLMAMPDADGIDLEFARSGEVAAGADLS